MAPRKVIIDTDPGQDDALAILLALGSPELDVLGITCVAGNVPLSYTVRNARLVCELAGRPDVAIFAGCDRPMVRKLVTAEAVHGKTGLDGPEWDEPTMPVREEHAVAERWQPGAQPGQTGLERDRATGVTGHFVHPQTGKKGARFTVRARRGVFVAASAIHHWIA